MKGAGGLSMIQTFQTKKFQTGVGGGGVKGTLALFQNNRDFFLKASLINQSIFKTYNHHIEFNGYVYVIWWDMSEKC